MIFNNDDDTVSYTKIIKWIGVVLAIPLIWMSFFTVDSGERAIVLSFGSVTRVHADGLHLKWPLVQSVVSVDVRTRKAQSPADAGTKDMQRVTTAVALNYHLDASKLETIYAKTGLEVEERIIDPRIQEVVKAVVAKYSADNLLSQRETVKQEIATALKSSVLPYNIVIEDIQITDFKFSDAYNTAIEAKQTAEQGALKAKNDLDRIRVEAEQKIATAEAEAQTIRIQADAIRAQGGKEYVQLKAIEKWDGKLPQYHGGSAPLPFVNVK